MDTLTLRTALDQARAQYQEEQRQHYHEVLAQAFSAFDAFFLGRARMGSSEATMVQVGVPITVVGFPEELTFTETLRAYTEKHDLELLYWEDGKLVPSQGHDLDGHDLVVRF